MPVVDHTSQKSRAAGVSIASNVLLLIAKALAAFFSGSVSVLSEAANSVGDVLASALAYVSVRVSDRPADEEHPFGHGKVESFAGMAEALVLVAAAVWVAVEAIHKFLFPEPINVDLALAVVTGAAIWNIFIGRYLTRVATATDSDALRADAAHITADVVTSIGVLVALGLVRITGNPVWDPIVALVLTLWILYTALRIAVGAFQVLIDKGLPSDEVALIEDVLREHPEVVSWHQLRTRKAGSFRHIDAHILLRDELSLIAAHDITEEVEDKIRAALPNVVISLHMEPYRHETEHRQKMHNA